MDHINTPISKVSCLNVENPEKKKIKNFEIDPLLGVLGVWMTFKKAEMAKTRRNGLSMIEMNPLNHNWLYFAI